MQTPREQLFSKILAAKHHFETYKGDIELAEELIQKGLIQKNKIYLSNSINILSRFVSNTNVKEIIKMVSQEISKIN